MPASRSIQVHRARMAALAAVWGEVAETADITATIQKPAGWGEGVEGADVVISIRWPPRRLPQPEE